MKLKNIRFSLKFNNGGDEYTYIHSWGELAEKLNLDDLYEYFESGQLHRWLVVQGECEKAKKVENINREATVHAQIKSLFAALDFQLTPEEEKAMIDSYYFPNEIKADRLSISQALEKNEGFIHRDFENYTKTLKEIIEVSEDFSSVKALVRGLLKYYPEQFKLDFIRFYEVMVHKCPLAIFVVLMDEKFRKYFLPTDEVANINFFGDLSDQFQTFPKASFATAFKEYLKYFFSATRYDSDEVIVKIHDTKFTGDSYLLKDRTIIKEVDYSQSDDEWQDVVSKDTPVMILHCSKNITIRPCYDKEHQYRGDQLPEKFMIFNGLDFRAKQVASYEVDKNLLLYMEVK